MKRQPFAIVGVVGLPCLLAIGLATSAGGGGWLPVTAACAAVFVAAALFFALRRSRNFTAALAAAGVGILLISFAAQQYFSYIPAVKLDGITAFLSGTVLDEPVKSGGGFRFSLLSDSVSDPDTGERIFGGELRILVYSDVEPQPFQRFEGTVELSLPRSSRGFDGEAYYKSKGVYLYGYAYGSCSVTDADTHRLGKALYGVRRYCGRAFDSLFGGNSEAAAFANAVLLGDRSHLSDDMTERFRLAGAAHFLAVSGMHTSIVAGFAVFLLKLCGVGKRARSIAGCVIVLLYMALLGFTFTVTRAGIMTLVMLLGGVFWRRALPLNSLGFAIFVILLIWPFGAMDAGFLLSVSATYAIIVTSKAARPYIEKLCRRCRPLPARLLYYLLSALAVSLSAAIGVLPVSFFFFDSVSLMSVASSLLLTPLLSLLLPVLMVSLLLFPAGIFNAFAGAGAGWLVKVFLQVCDFMADRALVLHTGEPLVALGVITALLAMLVLFVTGTLKRRPVNSVLSCLCLFLIFFFARAVYWNGLTEVTVISNSYGSALVITTDNYTALVGSGYNSADSRYIKQLLTSRGINKLDLFAVPSPSNSYGRRVGETAALFDYTKPVLVQKAVNTYQDPQEYAESLTFTLPDGVLGELVMSDHGYFLLFTTGGGSLMFVGGNPDNLPAVPPDVCLVTDRYCNSLPEGYNVDIAVEKSFFADADVMSNSGTTVFKIRKNGLDIK